MAQAKRGTSSRKPIQAFAFVDSNIFLDFYRTSNEANLSLLEKLKLVKERILSTYQVEMEVLKNRQEVVLGAIRAFAPQMHTSIPAVVSEGKIQPALKRLDTEVKKKRTQMEKRVKAILKNPNANDPVWDVLKEIFASAAGHVLTRDMAERQQIKRRAWKRFLLGYPPRKARDTLVGDALNWEWIVHCSMTLKGRMIIVSRDSDYGCEMNGEYFLNDQLKAEFRQRVGNKSIVFTKKLSEALRALEVHVSKEEKEAEDSSLSISELGSQARASAAALRNLPSYTLALKQLQALTFPDYSAHIGEALKNIAFPDYSQQALDALRTLGRLQLRSVHKPDDDD